MSQSTVEPTDIILHEGISALDALASLLCVASDKEGLTYVNAAGLGNLVRVIHSRLAVGEQQSLAEQQRLFRLENASSCRRFAEELDVGK